MLVRGRMTREVVTASPSTTIADALETIRTHLIRHLPIVDDGRVVGVVSQRDIAAATGPRGVADPQATLASIMAPQPITVGPDIPVESAARMLYEHRVGCLPVVEHGKLIGILTASDLLRAFVELMVGRERHSRLEILMPDRPGELARVVRLIGIDHGVNITGVVVPPPTTDQALVVLHLESDDVVELLEALRKLGYQAGSPALEARPA